MFLASTRTFAKSAENPVLDIIDIPGTSSSGSIPRKQTQSKLKKPVTKYLSKGQNKEKKLLSHQIKKIKKKLTKRRLSIKRLHQMIQSLLTLQMTQHPNMYYQPLSPFIHNIRMKVSYV